MDACPGNSEGHLWVLRDCSYNYIYATETRRTWFKKQIVKRDSMYYGHSYLKSKTTKWYCSKCRQFDTQVETLFTDADIKDALAKGYAILGQMPQISTKEANGLNNR